MWGNIREIGLLTCSKYLKVFGFFGWFLRWQPCNAAESLLVISSTVCHLQWKEAVHSGGDTADVTEREFSWTVYIEFPMKCNCEFQSSSRSKFCPPDVANEILWLWSREPRCVLWHLFSILGIVWKGV